jgi:hypothetical protein
MRGTYFLLKGSSWQSVGYNQWVACSGIGQTGWWEVTGIREMRGACIVIGHGWRWLRDCHQATPIRDMIESTVIRNWILVALEKTRNEGVNAISGGQGEEILHIGWGGFRGKRRRESERGLSKGIIRERGKDIGKERERDR